MICRMQRVVTRRIAPPARIQHRDEVRCPACEGIELEQGRCRACDGVWCAEGAVQARSSIALEITTPKPSRRNCPQCGQPMTAVLVFDVPIERCDHGMWFDKAEHDAVGRRSTDDTWRLHGGPPDYDTRLRDILP